MSEPLPTAESGLLRRLAQIEQTAHRVHPSDVGVWRSAHGKLPSPADGVVIAPADLAWLLRLARTYVTSPGSGGPDA